MKRTKTVLRHRKACRPLTPLTPITDAVSSVTLQPVRGTAFVSVTGLALTAAVVGTAQATPEGADAPSTHVKGITAGTEKAAPTLSVPNIAWKASDLIGDEAAVTAVASEEAAPATEEADGMEAANRDEARAELTDGEQAPIAVNAASGDIVSIAMSLLGVPYVYGGSSPAGFDCSGFTQYVYGLAGISIPRTSGAQGAAGVSVPASEAQPGDLVWHAYGHVGIYAGNGMVIEATTPGSVTKVQGLWGSYEFIRVAH